MYLKRSIINFILAISRLREDARGATAVMFGLCFLPMAVFVGAAVDYGRAINARYHLQAALDSTALMVAKSASSMTPAQLQAQANTYFLAQMSSSELTNVSITAAYTNTNNSPSVSLTSNATLPTTIMAIVGQRTMPLSTATKVVIGGGPRLRVALVLDNTGSMAQSGKMSALQTATKNLISQLQSASTTTGDVYASIIPFNTDVNVGSSNYAASWIDWTDWDNANGSCSKNKSTKSSCLNTNGVWTVDHTKWNGCITDRGNSSGPNNGNYDTNVSAPVTGNSATLYPADQYSSCPQAMLPLSNNWTAMTSLVNAMSPNGNTNQAIGLVHGWLSLVGGGPYPTPPAMDPAYQYKQVIILLTDGLNTADRWYNSESSIDARQQLTCANIKASNIELYTIQVNTGGDPTSAILQTCATDSSHFYLLTNASQIIDLFQQIGTTLTQLRIAS